MIAENLEHEPCEWQSYPKIAIRLSSKVKVYKGAGFFHSASQGKEGFLHFRASDFHETFTRSSLALNSSRKLISGQKLAIHGKVMAKTAIFLGILTYF